MFRNILGEKCLAFLLVMLWLGMPNRVKPEGVVQQAAESLAVLLIARCCVLGLVFWHTDVQGRSEIRDQALI